MNAVVASAALVALLVQSQPVGEAWQSWSSRQAQDIGRAAYVTGRVGGIFDTRLLKTERSYNYKLAGTWLHADVIRATARLTQLAERLTPDQARTLVTEADVPDRVVVMVEIDPREGSGVIPRDWMAFLQPVLPGETEGTAVRGNIDASLRDVRALAGVLRRNYDYDRFWVVFPQTHPDGSRVVPDNAVAMELVVRIHDREGRVRWPLPGRSGS